MNRTLLLAAALTFIPIAAFAQEASAPPTPEQIVGARQSKMGQGGAALAALKQGADAHADLTALVPRVEALIQWSDELPTMFPEGSNLPVSDAKAAVWTDRAGFDAAAARFQAAARTLAEPAAANDHEAFLARWAEVRATCGGCHDGYKN